MLREPFARPDGMALHRFSPLVNDLNADGANPAAGFATTTNARYYRSFTR